MYPWFVRTWLQNVITAKLREKAADAVRDQLHAASEAESGPEPDEAPRPCDVGLVFALETESGCLEDLLEGMLAIRGHGFVARQGGLKGRHVVVIRSSGGRKAAAEATEVLALGHQPKWIISAGFAGALTPDLQRHDIVLADSLVDTAGNRLALDLKVDPASLAQTPRVHVGRLLTADRMIALADEKRSLGQQHEALAVDMESFAVAEVCRRLQTRFLAVRIISDPVDEQLPRDVERLIHQKTYAGRFGAALGTIFNRPSSVKDMLRLKENALVASDRLAKFLASMIEQLVPPPPTKRT
jgi:adenosylhomocysteine nucleosidase